MNRFVFTFLVFLMSIFTSLALPTTLQNGTSIDIEKRQTYTGRGTWFHTGQGNCGQWNTDSDPIVAISLSRYNANNGGNCNQWLHITNNANGNTASAYVRDSCPGCGWNDLDMSPSLFSQLANLDVGEIQISWYFT